MTIGLFFDTETTGKFDFKSSPFATHQPHITQLAYKLVDLKTGGVLAGAQALILPQFFTAIEPEAAEITGLSMELLHKFGVPVAGIMKSFLHRATQAQCIFAHNKDFDLRMIKRTLYAMHMNVDQAFSAFPPQFCTMKTLTNVCRIPNPNNKSGFKWPKLIEAYKYYHDGAGFSGAHDAMVDVEAMIEITKKALEKGDFTHEKFIA